MDTIKNYVKEYPVRTAQVIRALLLLAIAFGVAISSAQVAAIMAPIYLLLDVSMSKVVENDVTPSSRL